MNQVFDVDGQVIIPNMIESNDYINQCMDDLRFYKKCIKDMQMKVEILEDAVKHFIDENEFLMNARGEKIASYGKYTRETFDKKAFESDHPGIYTNYVKQTDYRMFKIY